ncbi:calmodulin-binding family protein [Actinidia rufa]|uniref:Calmodulin-binding family protein n=1 Tax=Actinidia rufa TaxID=165716 RepID=A0A7J0FZ10_9ERIC|nr:calmodulin-binding family protein [Actinidia rufa]
MRWKLLDFAKLKRNSISFFDIEKPEKLLFCIGQEQEPELPRLERVYRRIKGLRNLLYSIGSRQQIDPRHRYGHNLQFYYVTWLHCKSKQPLDIGEGKEVNLERCPRSKLQQQCIKYLGPTERKAYEVAVEDRKFFYKQTVKLFDTGEGLKMLSGFLSSAPPRLCNSDGLVAVVHINLSLSLFPVLLYRKAQTDEEEYLRGKIRSEGSLQNYFAAPEFSEANARPPHLSSSRFSRRLRSKITTLEIPGKDNVIEMFKKNEHHTMESPLDGYETTEEVLSDDEDFTVSKRNLFNEDREIYYDEPIPAEKIIERINSHKARQSYQLAQRLSCKWSTGGWASNRMRERLPFGASKSGSRGSELVSDKLFFLSEKIVLS